MPVLGDLMREGNEAFAVNLASPVNATLGAASAQATIVDDDPVPTVTAEGCAVVEGDAGNVSCLGGVRLSNPNSQNVVVDWTTNPGTATPGTDYVATGGVLTFLAGDTQRTASATVLGDTVVEADESFTLAVTAATNATVGSGQAAFVILDDDAPSLAHEELAHGSSRCGGPGGGRRRRGRGLLPHRAAAALVVRGRGGRGVGRRRRRRARSSAWPPTTSTVLQTAHRERHRHQPQPALAEHAARALVDQLDCACAARPAGPPAAPTTSTASARTRRRTRSRASTTPRRRSRSLVLQNRSARAVTGRLYFWDAAGHAAASHPFALAARGTLVQNTTTLPALAGRSGSITVSNDGGYGDLTGKAVALEPATGFSFDSPLVPRPR